MKLPPKVHLTGTSAARILTKNHLLTPPEMKALTRIADQIPAPDFRTETSSEAFAPREFENGRVLPIGVEADKRNLTVETVTSDVTDIITRLSQDLVNLIANHFTELPIENIKQVKARISKKRFRLNKPAEVIRFHNDLFTGATGIVTLVEPTHKNGPAYFAMTLKGQGIGARDHFRHTDNEVQIQPNQLRLFMNRVYGLDIHNYHAVKEAEPIAGKKVLGYPNEVQRNLLMFDIKDNRRI